jgi:hypothetical protein
MALVQFLFPANQRNQQEEEETGCFRESEKVTSVTPSVRVTRFRTRDWKAPVRKDNSFCSFSGWKVIGFSSVFCEAPVGSAFR